MSAINSLREMLEMLDAYLYIWDETLKTRGHGQCKWKKKMKTIFTDFSWKLWNEKPLNMCAQQRVCREQNHKT